MTSLIKAIREGQNAETIKKLIEHGASVNEVVNFQRPLDVAIEENNVEIVRLLLEYVNYNICKTKDGTEQAIAKECGSFVSDSPELHLACKGGRKDIVQLLIDYGHDVNNLDEYRAISEYSSEIVELILHKGDEIFITPRKEGPFISFAISSGALDTAKVLLRYMVNKSSPTKNNWNAFSCAIFEANFNLVKELFETGHEIDLLCVYTALVCDNNEILELIWKNVTPELVSNDLYFMKNVFDNLKSNESIPQLWLLLNKEGVDLHFETCYTSYDNLISREPEIFGAESKELLDCFTSRGFSLSDYIFKTFLSLSVQDMESIHSLIFS